jgi:hypothetical protein
VLDVVDVMLVDSPEAVEVELVAVDAIEAAELVLVDCFDEPEAAK